MPNLSADSGSQPSRPNPGQPPTENPTPAEASRLDSDPPYAPKCASCRGLRIVRLREDEQTPGEFAEEREALARVREDVGCPDHPKYSPAEWDRLANSALDKRAKELEAEGIIIDSPVTFRNGLAIWQNGQPRISTPAEVIPLMTPRAIAESNPDLFAAEDEPEGWTLADAPGNVPTLTVPGLAVRLADGEVTALFGVAGAGKTTVAADWAVRFAEAGRPVAWVGVEGLPQAMAHCRRLADSPDIPLRFYRSWPPSKSSAGHMSAHLSEDGLLVLDSVDASLGGQGRNSAASIHQLLARLRAVAPSNSILWLDHAGHRQPNGDTEAGRRPVGSSAKIAIPRVMYRLSIDTGGRSLDCSKWCDIDTPPNPLTVRLDGSGRPVYDSHGPGRPTPPDTPPPEDGPLLAALGQEFTVTDYRTAWEQLHPNRPLPLARQHRRRHANRFAARNGFTAHQSPGKPTRYTLPNTDTEGDTPTGTPTGTGTGTRTYIPPKGVIVGVPPYHPTQSAPLDERYCPPDNTPEHDTHPDDSPPW